MRAYKGFNKDMTCRGFQFEECKTYEESEAILCERGFHACTNPIDVFTYYPPATSIYHEVELDEVSEKEKEDTKICGRRIKIGKQLSLNDMISDSIEISMQLHEKNVDYSHAATSGVSSPAATSGDYSHAATSGKCSHAATSGKCSHAATSGDYSPAATSGDYSIAAAIGRNSKAKSTIGNWIVLAEYGEWNGKTYPVLCVKCGKIDGVSLKPDTYYQLENGEFVEVAE